jgi:hypothetical protein
MSSLVQLCTDNGFNLKPDIVHVDFEESNSSNLLVWMFIFGSTSCVSDCDLGKGGYVFLLPLLYTALATLLRSFEYYNLMLFLGDAL